MGQFVAHKNLPILLVCCEKKKLIYLFAKMGIYGTFYSFTFFCI